jgi:DNA-directed RNA polymerase specialized sigma24 family protein
LKRGGEYKVSFDTAAALTFEPRTDILDVDEALTRLAAMYPRKPQVIEMLFFGGLTYQEAAGALGISEATLHRELKIAKAWLYRDLKRETHDT